MGRGRKGDLSSPPHRERPHRRSRRRRAGRWLGHSLAELVAERGGHPSDVLADFALANDCRPGLVAVGISNADVEGMARTLTDPAVLISSSDAGAHVQMLCASGDTTLLLTRHVRERNDLGLEDAVYQLTGRQAELFGFAERGGVDEGQAGDLAVFGLDELRWEEAELVAICPMAAPGSGGPKAATGPPSSAGSRSRWMEADRLAAGRMLHSAAAN